MTTFQVEGTSAHECEVGAVEALELLVAFVTDNDRRRKLREKLRQNIRDKRAKRSQVETEHQ